MRKLTVHSGCLQGIYYLLHSETHHIFQRPETTCTVKSNAPSNEKWQPDFNGKKSYTHLGNLPHFFNGGPFIWKLGKYFFYFGNEAVDVEVGLWPALREVKLWNAFTQHCGNRFLRPQLGLGQHRSKQLAKDASTG